MKGLSRWKPSSLSDAMKDADPPYAWAALAGSLVLALYAATLAPTTQFWDASEYIATGHMLGIPHPPGNPFFVILARSWDILLAPFGLPVAVRMNLLSAFMSAGAHALWFLVVYKILGWFSKSRFFRLAGAFASVIVSATAFTVWNQSNVNEKVYTISLFTIALLTWLAFRWRDGLGRERNDKLLVLIAFLLALSVGNHLMAFLAAPALGLFVLLLRPRVLLQWKLIPLILLAATLGLSVYLVLPVRGALNPVINTGATSCESVRDALASVLTYGRTGCTALSDAITRKQYEPPVPGTAGVGTIARQSSVAGQYVNYLQYFDWQWARSIQGSNVLFALLRLPFTILFVWLGVLGAIEHSRRDRPSFAFLLTLFGTVSAGLVFYLNFELGYSMPGDPAELREVRERDYFFIVSFSLWGLWAGMGIASLWSRLASVRSIGLLRAAPLLGLALLPLVLNWSWASRRSDWSARDYAYNQLMSVGPYGVLITNGDNDTFPLWYLQEVEGIRRDVTVAVSAYLETPWYLKQLRDLSRPCPEGVNPLAQPTVITCQRPYEGDAGGAAPSSAITKLDDAAIDAVVGRAVRIDQAQTLRLGPVEARLQEGQVLYPRHQLSLFVISDSLAERPIHFTSSYNAVELGLGDYLVRDGLTLRVHPGALPETAFEGFEPMPAELAPWVGPWVDVPRTRALLEDVFVHRGGLPDWEIWKDRPSANILYSYAAGYLGLAQAADQRGEVADSARYQAEAERWLALAR